MKNMPCTEFPSMVSMLLKKHYYWIILNIEKVEKLWQGLHPYNGLPGVTPVQRVTRGYLYNRLPRVTPVQGGPNQTHFVRF